MSYTPSPYVSWIKTLSYFKKNEKIFFEKDGILEIIVHPLHKPLIYDSSDDLYNSTDKQDKTIQLYFYTTSWIIPLLTQGNDKNIQTAFEILDRILKISSSEKKLTTWNMLWDDHAVCERLCVFIEIITNYNFLSETVRNKLNEHIDLIYDYIKTLLESEKWRNNNHRIFHLLAALFYFYKKQDLFQVNYYTNEINLFLHELIDNDTGFSKEQCISYCFFDVQLAEEIINALSPFDIKISFDIKNTKKNLLKSINALSFPDGKLPASGDTAFGMALSDYQKKYAPSEKEIINSWRKLDLIGYHRGASKNKKIQILLLEHNAESAHGHYSPLHTDIWFDNFGLILTDVGGPYKYGSKERYNWFKAPQGHNSLSFDGLNFTKSESIYISKNSQRDIIEGFVSYLEAKHGRKLNLTDNEIIINEFIYSSKSWKIYYNFAPGIKIIKQDNFMRKFILENSKGEKVFMELNGNDLEFSIKNTQRCSIHNSIDNGESLIISSTSNITFFSLTISNFK